ncbi:hypothetical protein SADUNF_Sadunf08G0017000 [Salix dunnii]|uniref:Uncharacterized protein n=1 Tax=Salix dunnii TaxID=1413687 RepID=A0A835MT30_9ROSI|nr:hypothetical protein SADUNF_Sadunf08G0017000 [Salix dunnii]
MKGSGPSCPLDESAHKKFFHKIKLTRLSLFYIYPHQDLYSHSQIHQKSKQSLTLLIDSNIKSRSILSSQRLLSSDITIMSEGNHRDASSVCPEVDIYQCDTADSVASSSSDSPFLGTCDDLSLLESGLYQQKFGYFSDKCYRNQDKALESIDSRELFIRRSEVFKKLFPELHDEFAGMFKKIGTLNLYIEKPSQVKTRALCLQRSFSVDSPRTPSRKGLESPLTLERFKVRTVVPGGGGQGPSKSK